MLARHVVVTRQKLGAGSGAPSGAGFASWSNRDKSRAVERLSAESAAAKAHVETLAAQRQSEIAELALADLVQQSATFEPSQPLFIHSQLPPADEFVRQTLAVHPGLKN